jgi:hypothetical protein
MNIFRELIAECREADAHEIADYLVQRPQPSRPYPHRAPRPVTGVAWPSVPVSGLPVMVVLRPR